MLCHDPRLSGDRDHRIETDNPALVLAEMVRTMSPWRARIDWARVARDADRCDEEVAGDAA